MRGGEGMKEKFVKAEIEVIEFEVEDVITASGFVPGENELPMIDPFA